MCFASHGDRCGRTSGARNARVASILAAHGFTKKDLDEGWKRLAALTDNRMDNLPPPPADPHLVVELDAWENTWFPIAGASLEFRYPDVHAWLFNNLHQTDGLDVLVSVGTFLKRLGQLPSQKDLQDAGPARKLLETRGLNASTVKEAQDLLDRAGTISKEPPSPAVTPEQTAAAETALWGWYLEWSTIARTVIDDRRLLRLLGFLTRDYSVATDSADTATTNPATTPQPTNGASSEGATN